MIKEYEDYYSNTNAKWKLLQQYWSKNINTAILMQNENNYFLIKIINTAILMQIIILDQNNLKIIFFNYLN